MQAIQQGIREAIQKVSGMQGDALRKAMDDLRKSITVSTGFNIANLEKGYVNLVPIVFTWFRDRVFRRTDAQGNAVSWTTLTGIDSNKNLGYVHEGYRAGIIQESKGAGTAAYATIGVEDSYTAEAQNEGASLFGGGEAGIVDLCIANLMQAFAMKEERILFGANNTLLLDATAAPTGVAASGGVAMTAGKYWCKVVPLAVDQLSLCSTANTAAALTAGLTKVQAVTSPIGETYNLNGGIGKGSAASAAVDVTTNQKVTWSVTAKKGAVAYAWYVSFHASADPGDTARRLLAITFTNSFVQLSEAAGTEQLMSALTVATDYSTETLAPTGVFYQVMNSSSAYWVSLNNTALTMTNGRVDQFCDLFAFMFNNYGITPEALHMSGNTYKALEILAFSASNPRTMFVVSPEQLRGGLVLGGRVTGVVNPYTGDVVDIIVNPNMPDSLIFAGRMNYPVRGTPSQRSVEVQSFGGLWRVDWAPITRTYWHGAYMQEAVKVYAPFCFGAIGNINIT
jgi:hypothetical protein